MIVVIALHVIMFESCIHVQLTGETSQAVSAEPSVTEEDTAEDVSDTEQRQEQPQTTTTITSTGTQQKPSTSRGSTKKRIKHDDDEAIAAIGQYFTSKGSKPSTALPAATADDDIAFGTVIGLELKKIKTSWIKRAVKKQLMETVFNGQEQEEQQKILQVIVSAESAQYQTEPQPSTSAMSQSEAELLMHIQQQQHLQEQQQVSDESAQRQTEPQELVHVVSPSDAQLLLQMQQQQQ